MKVKIDSPIGRRQLFIKEWQTARLYRTGFPLNKKRNITVNKGMNKLTTTGVKNHKLDTHSKFCTFMSKALRFV